MPTATLSTQAPAVLKALVAELAAKPELSNVQVTSGPMGPEAREKLEFWRIEGTQTWATFGQVQGRPTRDDEFVLTGAVWASRSGAGEEVITEARDRAYDILAELSDHLRENPTLDSDRVQWGHLIAGDLDQGMDDRKRWAQIAFRIEVHARI